MLKRSWTEAATFSFCSAQNLKDLGFKCPGNNDDVNATFLYFVYLGVFESPTGGESSDDCVVCFFTAIKVIFRASKAILSNLMRASF